MFAKSCLSQVLLGECNSHDLTIAVQGCLSCFRVSHQSSAAGPSYAASFVPWLSASCGCSVYMKQHEFPLFQHLNCFFSLGIAKMPVAATQNSPYQRTGKDQEACRLVSLTLLSISADYFNSAVKCKRRWMYYGDDEHSERQSQRLHTAMSRSQPQPCAPLKKRKVTPFLQQHEPCQPVRHYTKDQRSRSIQHRNVILMSCLSARR